MVLASASPRRHVLLRHLLNDFHVDPLPVDEHVPGVLSSIGAVQIIARKKALALSRRHPGAWVLGADTLAVHEGRRLGKAQDGTEARLRLAELAGNTHVVVTGLALVRDEESVDAASAATQVRMDLIPRATVDAYIDSGLWKGKAGGYGIQDAQLAPHLHLDGSWSNVVGLPLKETAELLRRNGITCREPPDEAWLAGGGAGL